jgi:hypothetical protein
MTKPEIKLFMEYMSKWSWEKYSTSLYTAKIIDKNPYSRLGSANWQPNNNITLFESNENGTPLLKQQGSLHKALRQHNMCQGRRKLHMVITKRGIRTDYREKSSSYWNICVLFSLRTEGSSPCKFFPPHQDKRYNSIQCSKCIK